MERLWSPWRSQYIESFQTPSDGQHCVFCAAHAGTDDASVYLLHRAQHSFIIMNLYPYNSGHLLIIPNRHVATLKDLREEEKAELMDMIEFGVAMLEKALAPHGHNIGANLGRAAGAGIAEHLHFHIVPRWNGDTNFMPIFSDTKVISEEMKRTYEKLMEAKKKVT